MATSSSMLAITTIIKRTAAEEVKDDRHLRGVRGCTSDRGQPVTGLWRIGRCSKWAVNVLGFPVAQSSFEQFHNMPLCGASKTGKTVDNFLEF